MNSATTAKAIAALLFPDDAVSLTKSSTGKTGEEIFVGGRTGRAGQLTVSLNAANSEASVEWRSKVKGSGDRIFRIENFPLTGC